jgi:hypothetical protein
MTPSPGGGLSNAVNLEVVWTVTVTPESETLSLNETQQFVATVSDSADQTVTWFVNDIPGGDSIVGVISDTGIYIAPTAVPTPETVTIKAVSVADPAKFGLAAVTVILPPSDNYPRPGADSVLRSSPPLPQITTQGTTVAVLDWTSKDEYGTEEDLLAICHSLAPWRIPHVHTSDVGVASAYPFVAVAGALNRADLLTDTERMALVDYVDQGGTLLLWRPDDTELLQDLGVPVSSSHVGSFVRPLTFDLATGDPALTYIDHQVEVNWQLLYPDFSSTRGYADPVIGDALARWSDGSAAVARSDLGLGQAYVFGWRLRHILTDGESQVVRGEEPHWTNTLIVDADISRLLARGIYAGWAATPAEPRQFAPDGKPAALLITHDVDARSSYQRTPEFAQFESDRGFKATYLFTTAPYSPGWTGTLYDADGRLSIEEAIRLGHDIESHSFGHFPDYHEVALGSGTETASNYFPEYSWDLALTIGASVLGETGVSRWLLENDFGITVDTFRSGHLLVPPDHLEGLTQTGYRRDTTYGGGLTRGSFPFVAFTMSSGDVTSYPIMEYPVTLSDGDITVETLQERLDLWESVILLNYANNAPTVLLIHPVQHGPRLEALEGILDRVADLDLWIGDLRTFGEFWEAQGVTCEMWP